jgi:hypothetical protein
MLITVGCKVYSRKGACSRVWRVGVCRCLKTRFRQSVKVPVVQSAQLPVVIQSCAAYSACTGCTARTKICVYARISRRFIKLYSTSILIGYCYLITGSHGGTSCSQRSHRGNPRNLTPRYLASRHQYWMRDIDRERAPGSGFIHGAASSQDYYSSHDTLA